MSFSYVEMSFWNYKIKCSSGTKSQFSGNKSTFFCLFWPWESMRILDKRIKATCANCKCNGFLFQKDLQVILIPGKSKTAKPMIRVQCPSILSSSYFKTRKSLWKQRPVKRLIPSYGTVWLRMALVLWTKSGRFWPQDLSFGSLSLLRQTLSISKTQVSKLESVPPVSVNSRNASWTRIGMHALRQCTTAAIYRKTDTAFSTFLLLQQKSRLDFQKKRISLKTRA